MSEGDDTSSMSASEARPMTWPFTWPLVWPWPALALSFLAGMATQLQQAWLGSLTIYVLITALSLVLLGVSAIKSGVFRAPRGLMRQAVRAHGIWALLAMCAAFSLGSLGN